MLESSLPSPGAPAGQAEVKGTTRPVYELTLNGAAYRMPVQLSKDLPRGVVGLPVLPGVTVTALPAFGRLAATGEISQEGNSAT